jgi:Domain of unknown function (DUF4345)
MDKYLERRLLQAAVAIGCLVPLIGGLLGILYGASMLGNASDMTLDSHVRYLSGLLLGVGLGFLSVIPNIETQRARVTVLTALVVLGGLARLYGVLIDGWPAASMKFALVMELGVVPLLWLWQRRVAKRALRSSEHLHART